MGPYSEAKQLQRAESIQRLLDNNPQLDPSYRAVWQKHLINLANNETTYNYRVKHVYSLLKPKNKGWVSYE
jgi:hypothetical protein